ncbi:Ig-like domain-containing protein [Paenibacillus alkaliterrae]|nr:Ig-like domain-containing protein [Paenibacillus alkaliterrae]
MAAAVIADTAASKSVTWSVTNEDGGTTTSASISMNGLLQGVSPGTVKVVATAADGSGVMGEKLITILKKAPGGKPPVHDRSIIIEAQTVNGKASAAVDAEVLKNAIDAASGKTVAVSVKADSSAEEVKVFMPAEAFEEMTKKDKFELTIETGIASITLSKQALAGLLEDGPKSIQLNISHVDKATLSEKERQQVGDSNVYDFNLFVNNEKVNHFEGGNNAVEVAVPYTPGPDEKPGKAVIYYMSDDGQLEAERNAKYDKKTGTVSFKTNRL